MVKVVERKHARMQRELHCFHHDLSALKGGFIGGGPVSDLTKATKKTDENNDDSSIGDTMAGGLGHRNCYTPRTDDLYAVLYDLGLM